MRTVMMQGTSRNPDRSDGTGRDHPAGGQLHRHRRMADESEAGWGGWNWMVDGGDDGSSRGSMTVLYPGDDSSSQ